MPPWEGAAFHCFPTRELVPVTVILPIFVTGEQGEAVRMLGHPSHMQCSHSFGSPLSPPVVVGYEWVRDDVLKYKLYIASIASVTTLQRQVKLENPMDSCKMVVQACRSDDFPFLTTASGIPPFFFMYRCLFEVLGFLLPLTAFLCALLEHLNMFPSQIHPKH